LIGAGFPPDQVFTLYLYVASLQDSLNALRADQIALGKVWDAIAKLESLQKASDTAQNLLLGAFAAWMACIACDVASGSSQPMQSGLTAEIFAPMSPGST
jgi:hypothetical protein